MQYTGRQRTRPATHGVDINQRLDNRTGDSHQHTDISEQALSRFVQDIANLVLKVLGGHYKLNSKHGDGYYCQAAYLTD